MPTAPFGERPFIIMANVDTKPNTESLWLTDQKKKNVVSRFRKQRMQPSSHQSRQLPPVVNPEEHSRRKKIGYWPQILKMHIRGIISVKLDSCIFPYIERHENYELEMPGFFVCVIKGDTGGKGTGHNLGKNGRAT